MPVIHHADVLDALRAMPDNSFHGCLTDPPYGLSFMGHQWDHGVPSAEVWREVLRVLRPGAHVLAFGGTRTSHRLTCAIEDAGFEIRDCMMWLYGSGFPKSHDVSKALDRDAAAGATEAARQWAGHGTALKPAWEPIIVARKPLEGTVAQNVQRWGCGALAIDASRVGHSEPAKTASRTAPRYSGRTMANGVRGGEQSTIASADPLGRWPANVIFDEEAGAVLDAQSGTLQARGNKTPSTSKNKKALGAVYGKYGPASSGPEYNRNDSGGASRFFYCAKASRKERDAGLEEFAEQQTQKLNPGGIAARREAAGLGLGRNIHPTVKPLALTTYLARLILPPVEGSRLLVPFCGSGSEMLGGLRAGWSHVEGIDSWDVAVKIARARTA